MDRSSLPSMRMSLSSSRAFMAHNPQVVQDYVANKVRTALDGALPQMEIRVKNLSLSAEIVVADQDADSSDSELPTLTNAIKKAFVSGKKHVAQKQILSNVSAVFRPGTVTLLLGQPGSGKSALMKVLSGRFPMTKNVKMEGEITYNDQDIESVRRLLPQFAAYVDQRDQHYATLTVKETLEFAHEFSGGKLKKSDEALLSKGTPEQNKAALDAARALALHYPKLVVQQLGLEKCQDTVVGSAMLRGVSGGERKRVTTGEMQFGMKYVSFMDEISTGLDAAATFDIVKAQRNITKKFCKTMVISLLQPSPEVFDLFDDVMILNEGEIMYHGPRDQIVDYFESLGFWCPPDRDIADYLLDLGTSEQHRYQVASHHQLQPRYANEYADAFRRSAVYMNTLIALESPHHPALLKVVDDYMKKMPEFHQSFFQGLKTLLCRESMVIYRNTPYLIGRFIMVMVMALLYASTYYQVDPTQVQLVLGVMFSSILFLTLGHAAQIPNFMAARQIFYKHRGANFFRTSTYLMALSVSRIPVSLTESMAFGSIVYWLCGFESEVWCFVRFETFVFLTNMAMMAWVLFISAVSPNLNVAGPLSMLSILLYVIFAGFIITKGSIPIYFMWLYWISPIAWGHRGIAVNQYRSMSFDVCEYNEVDYCDTYGMTMGEYELSLFGIPTEKFWVSYGMVALVVLYVFFMVLSLLTLEYKRYESPENVSVGQKEGYSESYIFVETPKRLAPQSPSYTDSVMVPNSSDKNFTPVTIAFQDLWYSVPDPANRKKTIDLLKGVSGYALPGTMTALMGSSGAGKTTLMDVIAGRKTGGKIRGKILLNGYEANDLAVRRCAGYCEQMDIHSDAATVREALTFSAFLRQESSISSSEKHDSVNECLDMLGLHDIADRIIRGSSVEQMKRLTIGVELAAQPSVIFLDEPTSGLDARSAKKTMDGVRMIANSGRTIVCTIHQPSSEVFFLFDNLLLLKRGGETVYFGGLGTNACLLVRYFESIPGVKTLPRGYNPATWMLETIGAGVGTGNDVTKNFERIYQRSQQKKLMLSVMENEGMVHPSPDVPELLFETKRAASSWIQMKFLLKRFTDMYWRTASYSLTRLVMSLLLGLLFGMVFSGATYSTYQGINSGVGMMYIVTIFNGLVAFNSSIPIAALDRTAFYRERASQTYNALWYFMGSTIAEIPYSFASGFLFTVVFFPMVGFTGLTTAVWFWIHNSLFMLMQTYLGYMFAYAFPSEEVAAIMGVTLNGIFYLFMGFSPPGSAIPSRFQWLYDVSPHRYSLSILVSLVFSDCPEGSIYSEKLGVYTSYGPDIGCKPLTDAPAALWPVTVKGFVEEIFSMKHADIGAHTVMVLVFIVVSRLLGLLALRFINHQKR